MFKFDKLHLYNADGDGAGSAGDTQQPTAGEPTVTMTQKALDALFAERGEQGRRALLKELGFEKPEDLKTILTKVKDQEEAQKTETQKLVEQAQRAIERANKAEADKNEALAKAQETLMRTAVMLAAKDFNDPKDAWTFIDRSKVKLNDGGDVDGVDKAIEELAKEKPYLLKVQTTEARPLGTPPGKRPTGGNKQVQDLPVQRVSY